MSCLLMLACGNEPDEGADGSAATLELASCKAWAMHLTKECHAKDEAAELARCQNDRRKYEPIGCGAELAEFVRCNSRGDVDCMAGGPLGCPDPAIYGQCGSGFTQRTGCSRSPAMDGTCKDGRFYFTCLDNIPSGCEKLSSPTSLGSAACCHSFAAQSAQYFMD